LSVELQWDSTAGQHTKNKNSKKHTQPVPKVGKYQHQKYIQNTSQEAKTNFEAEASTDKLRAGFEPTPPKRVDF
jgi:hypothetical protein